MNLLQINYNSLTHVAYFKHLCLKLPVQWKTKTKESGFHFEALLLKNRHSWKKGQNIADLHYLQSMCCCVSVRMSVKSDETLLASERTIPVTGFWWVSCSQIKQVRWARIKTWSTVRGRSLWARVGNDDPLLYSCLSLDSLYFLHHKIFSFFSLKTWSSEPNQNSPSTSNCL